ncbi:MAG: hypothetical protein U5P41_08250 [Gammaproteobacteria bacterium]|nr:hypothetical protein [Gammaproteobacteria bacterium]
MYYAQGKIQPEARFKLPAQEIEVIDKDKLDKKKTKKDDAAGAISPGDLKKNEAVSPRDLQHPEKSPAIKRDGLPAVQKHKLPAVQRDKLPAVQKPAMERIKPAQDEMKDQPGVKDTGDGSLPDSRFGKPEGLPALEESRPVPREAQPAAGGFVPDNALTDQQQKESADTSGSSPGLTTPEIDSEAFRETTDELRRRVPEHSPEWSAQQEDNGGDPPEDSSTSSTRDY